MKLEDLVPPLELCKQIPAGTFKDTYFVWAQKMRHKSEKKHHWIPAGKPVVITRDECMRGIEWDFAAPAPTYEEIMNAIRKLKCERLICSMQPVGWSIACWLNGECHIEIGRRAVFAALKVWFELKGIKYDAR